MTSARRWATTAAIAAWMLLLPGAARGDVVRPPPTDCVPGSEGTSGHSGPYCYPAKCGPDCKGGKACETRKLCIVMKTLGGGRRPRNEPRPVVESVVGSCDRGKKCESGECKSMKVCVPKARKSENPIETPIRQAGCGCSLGGRVEVAGGVFALLVGLGALLLRRRP